MIIPSDVGASMVDVLILLLSTTLATELLVTIAYIIRTRTRLGSDERVWLGSKTKFFMLKWNSSHCLIVQDIFPRKIFTFGSRDGIISLNLLDNFQERRIWAWVF